MLYMSILLQIDKLLLRICILHVSSKLTLRLAIHYATHMIHYELHCCETRGRLTLTRRRYSMSTSIHDYARGFIIIINSTSPDVSI